MEPIEDIFAKFQNELNMTGYAFQQTMLQATQDFKFLGHAGWSLAAPEFPVSTSASTRIDFVLKHTTYPTYLVCECKRVNPAIGHWVFARSTHKASDLPRDAFIEVIEDQSKKNEIVPVVNHTKVGDFGPHKPYHVGIEVKSQAKGDSRMGKDQSDAIEKATGQVCHGLSGLMGTFRAHPNLFNGHKYLFLFPVIFTTARLFTCDDDLAQSDPQTGEIKLDIAHFNEVPWLLYEYHLSPSVRGIRSGPNQPSNLSELLQDEYVRAVAIVHYDGMKDFLDWACTISGTPFLTPYGPIYS